MLGGNLGWCHIKDMSLHDSVNGQKNFSWHYIKILWCYSLEVSWLYRCHTWNNINFANIIFAHLFAVSSLIDRDLIEWKRPKVKLNASRFFLSRPFTKMLFGYHMQLGIHMSVIREIMQIISIMDVVDLLLTQDVTISATLKCYVTKNGPT